MPTPFRSSAAAALVAALCFTALPACDDKGPVEQAAEEVDEGIDTLRRGGDESTSNKIDDAVDEARDAAKSAAEDVREGRR